MRMPRLRAAVATPRVAVAVDDAVCASDVTRALLARGLAADPMPLERAMSIGDVDVGPGMGAGAIAYAPHEPPSPEQAARVAPMCRQAAEHGRPVIILSAFARPRGKSAWQRAAAVAYLQAWGAIVCPDPDVWLETICLIAGHGLPTGPRVAIVAPDGSLLGASATALASEAELLGTRFPVLAASTSRLEPVDIALVDRAALSPSTPERVGRAMVVPLVGRAELLGSDDRVPLCGLRAALGAVAAAGTFAQRMAAGLGPAQACGASGAGKEIFDALAPDLERFGRQADKLDTRAGDHEAKVLLAAWGIPVTRQAVATTPSAATRLAKKAGYPVEIKPWGPDQLSERDGCPVQRDLATAADVRRAMATVAKAAGMDLGAPVIVRETPPDGREVRAEIARIGALGWMVIVEVVGAPEPVAAPAPLKPIDAEFLASRVEANRASDPEPDRPALVDILTRASHLAVYHDDVLEALYLHRIIVTSRGQSSVVADAQAVLVPRQPQA